MTLAILFIMAMYVLMFFGHLEATKAMIGAGPSPQSHDDDGVVYEGQGTSSVPAFNRVGNLSYRGNGMSEVAFRIEGDRIYKGTVSGSPLLTIMPSGTVYPNHGGSSIPLATVNGNFAYRGHGGTASPLAYSPHGDRYLLALMGLKDA